MKPEDIPADIVALAGQAHRSAPQKRDGKPTRMRHALATAWPAIEAMVRAEVAAEHTARYENLAQGLDEIAHDGGMPGATKAGKGSPRDLRADARYLRYLSRDTAWITTGDILASTPEEP